MEKRKKPNGYWHIKENVTQEALKYKTRKEFNSGSNGAYMSAIKHNWLEEVCNHMEQIVKPKGYWNKEKCLEEALNYKHRNDFQKNSGDAYHAALKNKWLDEICQHMIWKSTKPQKKNPS